MAQPMRPWPDLGSARRSGWVAQKTALDHNFRALVNSWCVLAGCVDFNCLGLYGLKILVLKFKLLEDFRRQLRA